MMLLRGQAAFLSNPHHLLGYSRIRVCYGRCLNKYRQYGPTFLVIRAMASCAPNIPQNEIGNCCCLCFTVIVGGYEMIHIGSKLT